MKCDILKNYLLMLFLAFSFIACDEETSESGRCCRKSCGNANLYEFKRDGQSTVSFSGQTTRLLQAVEIYNALKDKDKTEAEIKRCLMMEKVFLRLP